MEFVVSKIEFCREGGTFVETISKKVIVQNPNSNIRWLKENLIAKQKDGSRFTKTLVKKQVLFFLNIPVDDFVLLRDCYKYSHELFLYTPGFGKINAPGPNVLITNKDKLRPIIMKPNSTIVLEKEQLKPEEPFVYMAYHKEFNEATGDIDYHCDALRYNSEADRIVISFDENGFMKKKEILKVEFPNLEDKDHDFPREYEKSINGMKNGKSFWISTNDKYAIWFDGQAWIIGVKSDMMKKGVKITNCVKTLTTNESVPSSAFLKWVAFNGIEWESILVICYEESQSNSYQAFQEKHGDSIHNCAIAIPMEVHEMHTTISLKSPNLWDKCSHFLGQVIMACVTLGAAGIVAYATLNRPIASEPTGSLTIAAKVNEDQQNNERCSVQ